MTKNPLVTVVIPSYNHQDYVAQSIQSVFSQTYKEIELIVIDDGSSDASTKVIQKLISWVECLCCLPITLYGLYLECKNPSYKYEPILDRPTIDALIDHYI
jgi:cellulose synthase/poly-beta-1,6-N-acetylglucosamine synthase-like glycosyltransferase